MPLLSNWPACCTRRLLPSGAPPSRRRRRFASVIQAPVAAASHILMVRHFMSVPPVVKSSSFDCTLHHPGYLRDAGFLCPFNFFLSSIKNFYRYVALFCSGRGCHWNTYGNDDLTMYDPAFCTTHLQLPILRQHINIMHVWENTGTTSFE